MPSGKTFATTDVGLAPVGWEADAFRRQSVSQGYIGETLPFISTSGTTLGISQRAYFAPVWVRNGDVITNVHFFAQTAAATLTLSKVALYNQGFTRLAISADASATHNGATGRLATALASSYTSLADQYLYVGLLQVGTTPSTFQRGVGISGSNPQSNQLYPYYTESALADFGATSTPALTAAVGVWLALS